MFPYLNCSTPWSVFNRTSSSRDHWMSVTIDQPVWQLKIITSMARILGVEILVTEAAHFRVKYEVWSDSGTMKYWPLLAGIHSWLMVRGRREVTQENHWGEVKKRRQILISGRVVNDVGPENRVMSDIWVGNPWSGKALAYILLWKRWYWSCVSVIRLRATVRLCLCVRVVFLCNWINAQGHRVTVHSSSRNNGIWQG